MTGKAFFIDTTKCTACRGCQIACKSWNGLPATETDQWGSHQNPKDLSSQTWKLVRFTETTTPTGLPLWYFFADQCRHCKEPPCAEVADEIKGAIVIDQDTGAVLHTKLLSKLPVEKIRKSCPFDIPRADPKTNEFSKCVMCLDRVKSGLLPACVKTCPTGTMNFGDLDKMITLAKERLEARKKVNSKAEVTGLEDLRVFYLFDDKPEKIYRFADASPAAGLTRQAALKKLTRPLIANGPGKFLAELFG